MKSADMFWSFLTIVAKTISSPGIFQSGVHCVLIDFDSNTKGTLQVSQNALAGPAFLA